MTWFVRVSEVIQRLAWIRAFLISSNVLIIVWIFCFSQYTIYIIWLFGEINMILGNIFHNNF